MFSKDILKILTILFLTKESLTIPEPKEKHIEDFIQLRRLRENGFTDFETTLVKELANEDIQSLDAASIHRRRRSVEAPEKYDIEIPAFEESYKMILFHFESVLHPTAKVMIVDGDTETTWSDEHPNCFLTGDVHSHGGIASASYCNELSGIMATDKHELHFEVLPNHIRRRRALKEKGHTTLIARKRRHLYQDGLKTNKDYVEVEDDNNHKHRQKRSVPSTSFTIELGVYCDEDFLKNDLQPSSTSDRIAAMLVKYNAVAFEWGRSDVLGYNVTLSIKLLSFFETNPLWFNTSSSLGVPLGDICAGTANGLPYDHVHVHTGVANPSLGGLAYQSQVCNVNYRCGVSADGVTSYVTTAHEIGHNMGMVHDADRSCYSPDVGLMGGSGVSFSSCSVADMNTMLQTGNHGCLWQDNISENQINPTDLLNVTLDAGLPGQMYTNDEICERIYGTGFYYREYPHVSPTTCNLFSCVDLNTDPGTSYGQMFKQSSSITGSYCEDYKICFSGCQDWSAAKLSNLTISEGGWSDWVSWTTCSRTCGRGVQFRKRKCDNPKPLNHATCTGNEHDALGCNLTPCTDDSPTDSVLINQRASESCAKLITNNVINGSMYKAEGQIYSSLRWGVCEVECTAVDGYTTPSLTRFGLLENGTPCPGTLETADSNDYPRRPGYYLACLEGYCKKFDCANTLNTNEYDGCGVCNGNEDTCLIRNGTFTDTLSQWSRSDWTTIPVGAYDIELFFDWNSMKKYYIEIYTKEGTAIIASSASTSNPARIFDTGNNPISYGGTLWHFHYTTQIMRAQGPLDTPVVAKVYNFGSNSNNGMNYIYSVPLNIDSCSGTCQNGGTWNTDICACNCASGFSGTLCNIPCTQSSLCKNGASLNESTCECICNDKQFGSLCDCKYPFTGGNCEECKYYTCNNGGTFNAATCRCQCPSGYGGLQCETTCADVTDTATCLTQVATGNCTTDNINMEQNCMRSCDLCVLSLNCTGTTIECTADSICIDMALKCDGKNDCSDGSDESCSWLSSQDKTCDVRHAVIVTAIIATLIANSLFG